MADDRMLVYSSAAPGGECLVYCPRGKKCKAGSHTCVTSCKWYQGLAPEDHAAFICSRKKVKNPITFKSLWRKTNLK